MIDTFASIDDILECGHAATLGSGGCAGYGRDRDGNRSCYTCCARADDRAEMVASGEITLHLAGSNGDVRVTNWPGSLSFPTYNVSTSRYGGGFGSQRTDAWFIGPDDYVWHAVNRGDMDVARCTRTRERNPFRKVRVLSIDAWRDGPSSWTWNQWFHIGNAPLALCDASPRKVLSYMRREGYLTSSSAGRCAVEDDGYNIVILDKGTLEPLFALEYGSIES